MKQPQKLGSRTKFASRRGLLTAGGLLLLAAASFFSLWDSRSATSFPAMPAGAYVGTISGLPGSSGSLPKRTFYLERFAAEDALLALIFEDGWNPKRIVLRRHIDLVDPANFAPLELNAAQAGNYKEAGEHSEANIRLTGSGLDGYYSGHVWQGERSVGHWEVQAIASEDMRSSMQQLASAESFPTWLHERGKVLSLKSEYQQLLDETETQQQRSHKLEALLTDQSQLQQRAGKRFEALRDEVAELERRHERGAKTLRKNLRSLNQLQRITRRGRTVELARRVTKREDKWYLVNWQAGGDLAALEEMLADRMNIDLRKLDVRMKQALEIQNLKSTINRERARVRKLERRYRERLNPTPQPPPGRAPKPKRKKEDPWWNRWDTIFG